ncbi:hypothetical protein L7F22_042149 [Adiantum nelumboides]|nr:hypothetical protein [Adiantum nelumboides]
MVTKHVFPAAYPRSDPQSVFTLGNQVEPKLKFNVTNLTAADLKQKRKDDIKDGISIIQSLDLKLLVPPQNEKDADERAKVLSQTGQPQLWGFVERISSLRERPIGKPITLIMAHATGFHKEIFRPSIQSLIESFESEDHYIDEIWSLDNFRAGDAGILNAPYVGPAISSHDIARDIQQFIQFYLLVRSVSLEEDAFAHYSLHLNRQECGQAKESRTIIAIGHSQGAATLFMAVNAVAKPNQPKTHYADVLAAIAAKKVAGYDPTLIDVYGRLLGYSLLEQSEGGIKQTLSSITSQTNYQSHAYPFPIITTVQSKALQQCSNNEIGATQYEYTPIEFGSWDSEKASFVPTKYTGSIIGNDGVPSCITGFDNLGFVMGASSDIFTDLCASIPQQGLSDVQQAVNFTESVLHQLQEPTFRDVYAAFPDSFDRQALSASAYPPKRRIFASEPTELYMMDGGYSGQVNPIWPFLNRQIDVLFVEDSSADDQYDWPNGSSIHETYNQAQARGLTRMPTIPTPAEFVQKGYNKRPTFFGCDQGANVMTIVYLPNNDYVYPSNTSTFKLSYTQPEIDGMLANGQAVATYNGKSGFETCVACVTLKKTSATLPSTCSQCFTDYCA